MERILDKIIGMKTKRKEYFEYLVKRKGHPVEDSSWETEVEIQKHQRNSLTLGDVFQTIFRVSTSEGVLSATQGCKYRL